jgi:signal peptidase I
MGTVRAHIGGLENLGTAEARRQEIAVGRAAAAQRRESASADDLRAHTPPAVDISTDAPPTARRLLRPMAAVLSLVVPGLGQLAVGRLLRGLQIYLAAAVAWAATITAAAHARPAAMWTCAAIALAVHATAAIDGFRIARQPRTLGPTWLDTAAALFAGFLLAALPVAMLAQARAHFVMTLPVQTPSMYPTLEVGDHLLVARTTEAISRGDLLVFRYPRNPNMQYVKRVIGVGGDVVEVRGDEIRLNGQALPRTSSDENCRAEGPEGAAACSMWHETLDGRSYRIAERAPDKTTMKVSVPQGHYFVLGDNRDGSNDSRLFGTVPADQVLGRAAFIWWSAHTDGVRWRRINRAFP